MEDYDFKVVDNEKARMAHFPLDRLRALAPTLPERSPKRLACMELIAENEHAMALVAVHTAARRASLALAVSITALVLPLALVVGWIFLGGKIPEISGWEFPRTNMVKPSVSPSPVQTPAPARVEPESTAEPLPASLVEPPAQAMPQ